MYDNLFKKPMAVINIGVKPFGDGIRQQGVKIAYVTWRPPVDKRLAKLLGKVL